ncbi:caspase family protein [Streptomyces clavuligerus]|uniref:caspase family protein n=1 Tax=Streptomyces clavuligerus TaxID=1901 RepID=UPI000E52E9BA|nr:caspase family protein [Streptomyces clavuligerus]AXU17022.1 hypothetical protein D1794_30710 [Streptomyces clavuligerus]
MHTVYALFVGIDDYPEQPLRGCVNDVRAAEEWLRRSGLPVRSAGWYDGRGPPERPCGRGIEDAPVRGAARGHRAAVVSGHGSEEDTRRPRARPTGRSRSLVCHDSLRPGGQTPAARHRTRASSRIGRARCPCPRVLDCCHSARDTRCRTGPPVARGVEWRRGGARGVRADGGAGTRRRRPRARAVPHVCSPPAVLMNAPTEDVVYRGGTRLFQPCGARHPRPAGPRATYGAVHALTRNASTAACPGSTPRAARPGGRAASCASGRLRHGLPLPDVGTPAAAGRSTAAGPTACAPTGASSPYGAPAATPRNGRRPYAARRVALVEPVGRRPGAVGTDRVYEVTPSALAFPTRRGLPHGRAGRRQTPRTDDRRRAPADIER